MTISRLCCNLNTMALGWPGGFEKAKEFGIDVLWVEAMGDGTVIGMPPEKVLIEKIEIPVELEAVPRVVL